MSREQQTQNSTSQVIQIQQPRGPPQPSAHYVSTVSHPVYNQEQNNQCKWFFCLLLKII